MDSQHTAEWLASLSAPEKLRALARLYLWLTIAARPVFLPGAASGKERTMLKALHGVNELHHTIANEIIACSSGGEHLPAHLFAQQLSEIAEEYGIGDSLAQILDFVRADPSTEA